MLRKSAVFAEPLVNRPPRAAAWGAPYMASSLCGELPMWRGPYVASSLRGELPMWRGPYVASSLRGELPMW